ncbi:MAG TPA: glycine zipper 2TM domain-containing protein [Parvibaculum sp.]
MDRISSLAKLAQIAFVATSLALPLAGCGTLVGAGVGGLVGSTIGSGAGRTAATIGGAAAGAVVGHAVTGD